MPTNPIITENLLPGTTSWMLTTPPNIVGAYPPGDLDRTTNRCPAIEGYAWPPSVDIGKQIRFYVSTTAASYSMQIFRMGWYGGTGGRAMTSLASGLTIGAASDPQPAPAENGNAENWKASNFQGSTSFTIPGSWVSGCFVAKLTGGTKQSYIFFVVRDDSRSSEMLMQTSFTTYQAYNGWGNDSVYAYNNLDETWRNNGQTIWFKRPFLPSSCPAGRYGAGTGAFFTHDKGPGGELTWSPPRDGSGMVYSSSGWEYNLVRWLEREGYDVTYCTNLDTHDNQLARAAHAVFISAGHDEYWSIDAYNNVVKARDELGMSLLWLSANTVWNIIDLANPGEMRVIGNYNPGNTTGPTDYGLVGGTWVGGILQENIFPSSNCPVWLLKNVTLTNGHLGTNIVGYETNGFDPAHPEWNALLPAGLSTVLQGNYARAIWYTSRKSGATVVSLSSVQWAWGLDDFTVEVRNGQTPSTLGYADSGVQQFTRNLFAHCMDAKNMVADLADGNYEIRSVAAYPQNLIVTHNGAPNAPVVVYGDGVWSSSNNQAKWIIQRYTGARSSLPIVGPYKAGPDIWYRIRNMQSGQSLIVGNNGQQSGPVMVIGDVNGDWGQAASNTQMMWRIWRYTTYTARQPAFLLQNVASGQLLIVGENGRLGGPVIVHGNYNGGWGEHEDNTQKLWVITPA